MRKEALATLKNSIEENGNIRMTSNGKLDCEEALKTLGVNTLDIKRSLQMIDYYSCSINRDCETHLQEDLDAEVEKIRQIWEEAGLEDFEYVILI